MIKDTLVKAMLGLGISLLLAGWPTAASAQGTSLPLDLLSRYEVQEEEGRKLVVLSLKELLELTRQRNMALMSTRLGRNIAEQQLEAAREGRPTTLTNSLSYGRNVSPSSGGGDFMSLSGSDSVLFNTTLNKPTNSGVSFGLSYTESRSRFQSVTIPNEGDEAIAGDKGDWKDVSSFKASIGIPLAQDFGSDVNRIPEYLGEVSLARSKVLIRSNEERVIGITASTYWDMVAALETVDVEKKAVALSQQLLRDNRQRLAAGVISPTDVQVTETQLARDRQRLLSAQLAVVKIEDQVRAYLNLESLLDYGLKPSDKPALREVPEDMERLREKVFKRHPHLAELETGLRANALNLESAKNKDRPDLDLELYYTFNGYSSDPFQGTEGYSDSLTNAYGATLNWKVPLFNYQAEAGINQRMLEREQLQLQLNSARSELSVQLQSVIHQLRLSRQEAETAKLSKSLAEEQLKNEIERLSLGQSTTYRVAQAQQDAAFAQVQEVLVRVRFEKNYLELLTLTGDIYDYFGLEPLAD